MRLRIVLAAVLLAAFTSAQSVNLWSAVPMPPWNPSYRVHAVEVFDDGSGPALYVAGNFSGVARWDGASWSFVSGLNRRVNALEVFDDGTGPALYATGPFASWAGDILQWDGTTWSSLGSGLSFEGDKMNVYDDGTGPALYVAGNFLQAGGVPVNHIARWDGTSWSPVGGGLAAGNYVFAMEVLDDGTGPALYVGGRLSPSQVTPVVYVRKWNGSSWSSMADPPNGLVRCFATYDDGSGPALYVGGQFGTSMSGQSIPHIGKWDGSSWSPLGSGLSSPPGVGPPGQAGGASYPRAMVVFDEGDGPKLFVGGEFFMAGTHAAAKIARWDGLDWDRLYSGLDATPLTLAVYDDGTGTALYAGGNFSSAGGIPSNDIAKWAAGSPISLSTSQVASGSPVFVSNANLSPGNEYYNLFVIGCPAGAGLCNGPYGANWTMANINLVISQMSQPLGTPPYHVTAPSSYVNWGPFPGLPPLTLDAICIDFTGGVIGPVSPVVRIVVQ